jgi:hypothetical protein
VSTEVSGICHTVPFLRLFVPNSLIVPHPFGGSSGFPCTATSAPSLKPARPERLPDKVSVSPDSRHPRQIISTFALSLILLLSLSHSMGSPVLLHYRSSSAPCFYFRFGGGRPLHSVQFLFFRNVTGDPAICFAISIPVIFS